MRQDYRLVWCGLAFIVYGVASLFADDEITRHSGGYAALAGVLCIGTTVWVIRRGGWASTTPSAELQRWRVPTSAGHACPVCASNDTRPMTAVETAEFYGYERFVIVRPRTCKPCWYGFELDSMARRLMQTTLTAFGAILMVVLLSFAVIAPWGAWQEKPFDPGRLVITAL